MVQRLLIALMLITPIACLQAADNELPDIADAVFQGPRLPTPTQTIIPQNITPATANHALDMLIGPNALAQLEREAAYQTAQLGISFMGIPGMTAEKYEQLMKHAEGIKYLKAVLENEAARLLAEKARLEKIVKEASGS